MSAFQEVGKSELGKSYKSPQCPKIALYSATFHATHSSVHGGIEEGKELEKTEESKKLGFSLHKMFCRLCVILPCIKSESPCNVSIMHIFTRVFFYLLF